MQELIVEGKKISFYSAIEELPIKRYSKFQKYNLIESGIGTDIEAIGFHFSKLFEYQSHKMFTEALQETKNLYYNLYMILEEIHIPSMAFCCLIHSIDGEILSDLSEDNLKKTVDTLSKIGVTHASIVDKVAVVKKKSILN